MCKYGTDVCEEADSWMKFKYVTVFMSFCGSNQRCAVLWPCIFRQYVGLERAKPKMILKTVV